jgi:hypothetical protein
MYETIRLKQVVYKKSVTILIFFFKINRLLAGFSENAKLAAPWIFAKTEKAPEVSGAFSVWSGIKPL